MTSVAIQMMASIIVTVIAVVAVIASVWRRERYTTSLNAATSAAEAWREERDAELSRRERIAQELATAKEHIKTLEVRVAELERRPDLTQLHHTIELHEERAMARTERVLAALEMMTKAINQNLTSEGEAS